MPGPCILDLFTGAGGFTLGACRAGFSIPLAIEIDPDLSASHWLNFPRIKLLQGDISQLDPELCLQFAGLPIPSIAGIIGGPPCQGFSVIGKRNPLDPRNSLVSHFFRFVRTIKPHFFLMENVPGIVAEPFFSFLQYELECLANDYVVVGPVTVNSADYGAATLRKRVLILGYRPECVDAIEEGDLRPASITRATVRDAISDLPPLQTATPARDGTYYATYSTGSSSTHISPYGQRAREAPQRGLGSSLVRSHFRAGHISGYQPTWHTPSVHKRFKHVLPGGQDEISRFPRLHWERACPTLRAGTGKDRGSHQGMRPIHPAENRVITVREAARLQGFPDWFHFHKTIWHSFRMIGNSVSPYLAETVLALIASRLIGSTLRKQDNSDRTDGKRSAVLG